MELPYGGIVGYIAYFMSMLQEVFRHLFDLKSGTLMFGHTAQELDPTLPSSSQWTVTGNLPDLTTKGEDIIAAIMTIVHNGLVAVAQISTLLPSNALS